MGNSLEGAVGAFNDTVGSLEKRCSRSASSKGMSSPTRNCRSRAVVEQPQAVQAPEIGEQLRAIDAA